MSLLASLILLACAGAMAQVNSGSNGSDGAFNPMTNTVINMADHPDGIYQYTSVNIPTNVTVTFIPNANNTPLTWLVQSSVSIAGVVDLSGQVCAGIASGRGGPGGGAGGSGGQGTVWVAQRGSGLGGGDAGQQQSAYPVGAGGAYATGGGTPPWLGVAQIYGNKYLLPLLGGSGGGGGVGAGGGGGGGAILIACGGSIVVDGSVIANGGTGSGGGSGGGVRLVASRIAGRGVLSAYGGFGNFYNTWGHTVGGVGYVRLDALDYQFAGSLVGFYSVGFIPILIPPASQNSSLTIQSIGGNVVTGNPAGQLAVPDVALSAQQTNPIPIVVRCSNLPLNTPITVVLKPVYGAMVLASGANNTGTVASSTATVLLTMPRGGGIIYATAATGN